MENYHRLVLMKERNPVSHQISNVVPPIKVEEDKGKVSSASTKSVAECLQEERDVESATEGSEFIGSDLFEENFKELKKWVDVNSPKYGILLVLR
ncbi:tripeptidyl-peptidase 2-like [Punica granatum]|nr:tripeptidyl-peptidase 2-like [Punica granatum]